MSNTLFRAEGFRYSLLRIVTNVKGAILYRADDGTYYT